MPVDMEYIDVAKQPVLCVIPLGKEAFNLEHRLDQRVQDEIDREIAAIVVNLEHIERIDSLGLGALTGLYLKFHKKVKVIFVNLKPFVKDLIHTASMSKIFITFPTLEQGLEFLRTELKAD
jgi:anti-anti-sigma factor